MTGFDSKVKTTIGNEHDVVSKIRQIVTHAVETLCGVATQATVRSLLDQGALRPEAEDQAVCPDNHRYDRSLPCCPRCGKDGSETEEPLGTPDTEIEDDEDRPVSKPEEDEDVAPASEPGLETFIAHFLISAGVSNAYETASCLVALWAKATPPSIEALAECMRGLIDVEEADKRSLAERLLSSLHSESETAPQVAAHLRVFWDDEWNEWRCEAVNPLDGLVSTDTTGAVINQNGIPISGTRTVKWLSVEMLKILETVGASLIRHRKGFFEAPSREAARAVLLGRALTQKDVAEEVGVHKVTLNRLCTGGVTIGTKHGNVPLSRFFQTEALTDASEKRPRQAVIEELAEKFRARPTLLDMSWPEAQQYLRGRNLEMAERTWRNYKNEIRKILEVRPSPVNGVKRAAD